MSKLVPLAMFWGSVATDGTANRAGVASVIARDALTDNALVASQAAAVDADIAHETAYVATAESYSVVRSRFYVAFLLTLPMIALIAASWQLTLFGLEILPSEGIRNVTALALVGASLLSIHLLLESLKRSGWVLFTLTSLSVMALAVAHYQLAKTRAVVIADWILEGNRTVVESAAGVAVAPTDAPSLASTLLPLLESLLPLMAVGLEVMAGVALYFVLTALFDPALLAYWRLARLRRRAARLRARAVEAADRAERADAEAGLTINATRNARAFISKDAIIAIAIAIVVLLAISTDLFASPAIHTKASCTAENQRVALLIDLSRSRTADDVAADAAGVARVLSEGRGCSRYVVLGIGDDGWGAPIVLLDMRVTTSGGWMQQDLKTARRQLTAAWAQTAARLAPMYSGSDVMGTLLYAVELLNISPGRPGTLISFSDGRQTRSINLEGDAPLSPPAAARRAKALGLVANIPGSRTFFLGASTAGKSPIYWNSLRDFWRAWTAQSGASLGGYSVGRDVCSVTALCTAGVGSVTGRAMEPALPPPPPGSVGAAAVTHRASTAPAAASQPNPTLEPRCETLSGAIGSSQQWGSGWLELSAHTDFRRGETLRLNLGGGARKVVVRLLNRSADPNSPDGVDGGVVDVPPGGVIELRLQRDHPAVRQISVHGGVSPWGLYGLGGGNGPARLLSVERLCE
jgi:hypothetical protein